MELIKDKVKKERLLDHIMPELNYQFGKIIVKKMAAMECNKTYKIVASIEFKNENEDTVTKDVTKTVHGFNIEGDGR